MRRVAPFATLLALAGCQTAELKQTDGQTAALPTMERIALGARECWFRSGDPAFKSYRMAPELNSFSGKPRILLVPAKNPNGLPLAVIEASGEPARLNAFGPLMAEPLGTRIADDARRWATGHTGCSA